MRAWIFLALLFPVTSILTSCGSDDSVTIKQVPQSASVQELIAEADSITFSVNTQALLGSNSDRDKNGMISLIKKVRLAALKLSISPNDKVALQVLIDSSAEYNDYLVLASDKPRFDHFFSLVSKVIVEVNNNIGGRYDLTSTTLFSYKFSNGLFPFGSFASNDKWYTAESLNIYSARVRGHGNKSWLVSPVMDLREIKNPRIQFRHSIEMDPHSGGEIVNPRKIFKVKVARNFVTGDPNLVEWEDLRITKFPSGLNFHTIDSTEIDLSNYRGEKVAVAFLFDTTESDIPNGNYSWTIQRFQFLGSGKLPLIQIPDLTPIDNATYVFKKEFVAEEDREASKIVKGFVDSTNPTSDEVDGGAFEVSSYNDNFFIKVNGRSEKLVVGDNYLTSTSSLDLSGLENKEVLVSMKHSFNCHGERNQPLPTDCKPLERIKIEMAKIEADGSTPNWIGIDFSNTQYPDGGGWSAVDSGSEGSVKVPTQLLGESSVALRLVYNKVESITPTWQIQNIKLKVGGE
jgi:hypothetical protein